MFQFSDMNECELGLDNCHPNAMCSDVDGGFECFCNIGFEGDGTTCVSESQKLKSYTTCNCVYEASSTKMCCTSIVYI